MLNLTNALILEKNKLSSEHPWLLLLDVGCGGTTLYLVRNTENFVFNGITYEAFPFEIDADKQDTKGQIPSISLRVSNVTRAIQAQIEDHNGLIGETITLRVVNADLPNEVYTDLTFDFEVLNCMATAMWVTFTLGAPNPLNKRVPLYRYMSNFCRYVSFFKGAECKYAGVDTTCTGTLEDCQSKSNSVNFGGFIGLTPGGIRLV